MTKILHVYKSFYPDTHGGVEHFINTLTKHVAKFGYTNQLLTLTKQYDKVPVIDQHNAIEVVRYPMDLDLRSCPLGFRMLKDYKKWVDQADLIHYHFPWPFADIAHLLTGVHKPSVMTYHSDIVKQRLLKIAYQPICNRFLMKVDRIVATSDNYLNSSHNLVNLKEKCRVIPVGIDENDYLPLSEERVQHWNKELGNNFFLFVGVLRYYKGIHILLDALKGTHIPVVIAGKGPCEQELKKQVEQLGLTNVKFIGFVSDEDKNALLKLCRAVVFPSHLRSEAFGITLVEGLLFGKPLISCDIATGTSYVNKNEVTGYVVPPNNPDKLRESLQQLANNDGLVANMAKAARTRYEELFTAEKMANSYDRLYKEVL